MKTPRPSTLSLRTFSLSTLAAIALLAVAAARVVAQDTVTISATEFQRLAYSSHLYIELAEKPELDASLHVLLGLHQRNPHLSPASLAGLLQETTGRYRTNAPGYFRRNGIRDEILAAYLEVMRGVQKPAGFVPADLTLLKVLVTRAKNPGGQAEAGLTHSGSQAQLSGEYDAAERRTLLDACTKRARANSGFAEAMDRLLYSEIRCSVTNSAAEIIGDPDSPLRGNITMTSLLASNRLSLDGSLTICSNDVKRLFAAETQSLWDIVHTNLDLRLEFNWSQPDLLAYMTNQVAQSYWSNRMAEARQGQTRQIACSTAAVLVQSQLTEAPEAGFTVPEWVGPVCDVVGGLATLGVSGDPGSLISSIPGMLGLFDTSETPDEQIIREIGNIKTMIGDLSVNMNYRFDRVDQSLTAIFDSLNQQMDKIEIIDARTAHLNDSVDNIRSVLVGVQNSLYRIERNLATFAAQQLRHNLVDYMNLALGYEARVGGPMVYTNGDPSYAGMETHFYTHAYNDASGEPLSLNATLPFGDQYFYSQLSPGGSTNAYAEVLNYIKRCLRDRLGLSGFAESPTLANPQDWNAGAGAWLQLALENPSYFRLYEREGGYPSRLNDIITRGRDLTNFHRSLTFSGANVNSNLYTALGTYHTTKLNAFETLVAAKEDEYAGTTNFALNPWRPWDAAAPRITATNTALALSVPRNLIAAGADHTLAIRQDGTVIGWGGNGSGQTTIPAGLNNVVAVAAGTSHSAALRADGSVVSWGDNSYGEINIPADLGNVVAVTASGFHQLALRADGTVIGWGHNGAGQISVPVGLSHVVAIAGGGVFSLALKSDGTVVGWGWNAQGEATGVPYGPPGTVTIGGNRLTDVVAIDAGEYHSLALRADGTVVGWGWNVHAQATGIADGEPGPVIINGTPLSNVVAIAAGGYYSLALKADGTVIGWGEGNPATAGSALSFNGSNSYVELNRPVQDDFTIEFWFRSTQVAGSETQWWQGMGLVDGEVGGTVNDFGVSFGNGKVLFGTGNPDTTIRSGAALSDGRWHHVAATREKTSGAMSLFVDGALNATATGSMNSLTNPTKLRLGSLQTALNYFQGQIDEVRIWNRPLNQNEIQANMNISLTGTEANLVVYYHLDEGSGFTAHDATANHFDGTLYNSPTWVDSPLPGRGQATPPRGLGNVVGIAAGGAHSLALKADGTIVAWGDNSIGQSTARGWVATPQVRNHIAAGSFHSLALRADGAVVGWGAGLPGHTQPRDRGQATIPSGLTNVVAIEGGGDHSLALKANGTVVAWGWNYYHQTEVPSGLANVVAIAAGDFDSVALKADGTVTAWGYNNYGQTSVPTGLGNVVAIAAGPWHTLALKADGTVVGWGWNNLGQLSIPSGLSDVVAIAAGEYHSMALKADGTVVVWGSDLWGPMTPPAGLRNVVAISANQGHNLALKADGTVLAWGRNDSGEINVPSGLSEVVAIVAGQFHSLALKADGTVVGWGDTEFNQSISPTNVVDLAAWGENPPANWNVPPASSLITAVAAGAAHSLALGADGSVAGWGLNAWGQTNVPPQARSGVQAVAAGLGHSLVLTNGGVFAWGLNDAGQANVPLSAQSGVVAISAGGKHNLALRHDGTIVAWGWGGSGQTNLPGTLYNSHNSVVAIAAGGEHSLALDARGTVWAWGGNSSGQTTPIPSNVTNIVAIAAGRYHNLALTYDGKVRAWGLNSSGQCNVPAAAQSGVVAIGAGINHSLAIKVDGTAIVWGSGPAAFLPLQAWSNVVAIAAGDRHTMLLSAGGAPAYDASQTLSFMRGQVPIRVVWMIRNANDYVAGELGHDVQAAGTELSGAKALLQAVLQLGMPYTLESDEVLRGFLYGSESLVDRDVSQTWLQAENARLRDTPWVTPLSLTAVAELRQQRFTAELNRCLGNLREPEIPRLVGHTLRLLGLLRDAWTVVPPPSLEAGTETNALQLVLYGDPYAHYTLQYRDDLTGFGWTPTGITSLHSEQIITPPTSGSPRRFYRAMLPYPW